MIGDLHLQKSKNRARIKVVHGRKQQEYYKYKTSILGEYLRSEDKNYLQGYSKVGTISNNTLSSVELLEIANKWEHNKSEILSEFDDRAWAFAFMDNGSYHKGCARLHVNRLSIEDATIISTSLNNRYGINTEVRDYKGSTICFPIADYDLFCSYTGRYFHPSMSYKLRSPFDFEPGYNDSLGYALETVTDIS